MINVIINETMSELIISGHVDDSQECINIIEETFQKLTVNKVWKIFADDATLAPSGVKEWINASEKYLKNHHLHYEPSQLGMILMYDERFDDFDLVSFSDQYINND